MTVRIFRCRTCSHRLDFGVHRCHVCMGPAPHLNRAVTHEVAIAWGLALGAYLFLF